MLKLIYLANRKPGFTHDDFARRWRMHGALGMSTPFWRHALGYVQAEPIRPVPIAGASGDYDAVACLMVRDDTFTGPYTPEDIAASETMIEDEAETFAGPIPNVSLWVSEETLKPGALGGITAFLFFTDAGKARATGLCYAASDGLNRVVVNLKREGAALGPMKNTLPYAAIVELSASSVEGLKAVLGTAGVAPLGGADVTVVTREAVLWDRLTA